ncbi:uncharacterized protein LOC119085116 [Bradysia coprophila]|uniref:uncharacterized protein LOC119085116 n=1 Tax=Bradysia coprophila TaxID=38358 RepID=UPI00187DA81C|nr:uncharacterized protein LOC119085116 [Bradysia coprophila]
MKYFHLFCLFAISPNLLCALLVVKSAEPLETFNELFFRKHGWLGADGIYSCKISDNLSIWHFADTFIGDRIENKRTDWTLIRNSVGIENVHQTLSSFNFYWTTQNSLTDSFYLPPDGKGWLWPKAMVYHENKLHIFLTQLENWGPNPAWDYGPIAAWTAVVENPTDTPTDWKIRYTRTPFIERSQQRNITFDTSILRQDDYFYIYGFSESTENEKNIRDLITSRVRVNQFLDYGSYEFYNGTNWVVNFTDASSLFNAAGEFSVHYDNRLQQYLAVYSDSFPSSDILARTATTPSGPWSKPIKLYSVPEMIGKSNKFCYSGKAHPQMSGRNHLVVSYVCNSFVMNEVIDDATMYMPKFVRINYQLL